MNRNQNRMKALLLVCGAMIVTPAAYAAQSCTAPAIPPTAAPNGGDVNSLWKGYQDKMNQYRDCVVAYQKAELAEAKQHQENASRAVNEYNSFIQKVKDAQKQIMH